MSQRSIIKKLNKDVDKLTAVKTLVENLLQHSKNFKPRITASEATEYYYRRLPISAVSGGSRFVAPVVYEKVNDLHTQIMDVVAKIKDNYSIVNGDAANKLPNEIEAKILGLIESTMLSDEDEQVLDSVILESLITGTCGVRWFTETKNEFSIEYFKDFTDDELAFKKTEVSHMPDVTLEVIESRRTESGTLSSGQIITTNKVPRVRYEHLSFNDIYVDPKARSVSDANYLCIERLTTKQDLIDQGFPKNLVMDVTTESDIELRARLNTGTELLSRYGNFGYEESYIDRSLDAITVYEHYVRTTLITGKPGLYRIIKVGSLILDVIAEDSIPVAVFRPLTSNIDNFFGASYAGSLKPEQDVETARIRGLIDNTHNANHGRIIALKNQYNKRDLMDNRPGGIVEVDSPGAIMPYPYNPLPQGIEMLAMTMSHSADATSGMSAEMMGRGENAFSSGITAAQVAIQHSKSDLTIKKIGKGIMVGIRELMKGIYGEWRKQFPTLPHISTFRFEVMTEMARRSKSADIVAAAQTLNASGLMTPVLMNSLSSNYLYSIGMGDLIGLLKTPQMIQQEQANKQKDPATQLQLQSVQSNLQLVQAQTKKLVAEAEIEANVKASKQNLDEQKAKVDVQIKQAEMRLEEQKAKVDVQVKQAEMRLAERAQTLSEYSEATKSKIAMGTLALQAEQIKQGQTTVVTDLALDAVEKMTTNTAETGF